MNDVNFRGDENLQKGLHGQIMANAVDGFNAHLCPSDVLDGLDPEEAGKTITGIPYTIWQLIKHLNYWQNRFFDVFLERPLKPVAASAEGWTAAPAPEDHKELTQEIQHFLATQEHIKDWLIHEQDGHSEQHYDVVQALASHNSYHLGQIMLLRRLVGNYPPPAGGFVW